MRAKIVLLWLAILPAGVFATDPPIDPEAVQILDAMSSIIGDLNSVSFDLKGTNDVLGEDSILVQHYGVSHVYMVGPDKMLIDSRWTHKGHRGFWYNGKDLVYYSYDENNYAVIDTPPTIMETIDSVNKVYGVQFPGADFFYPSFTDDLIDMSDRMKYLGKKIIDDKECFHILVSNENLNIQIWITNNSYNLPVKFLIIYKNRPGSPQYEASFSNWNINPELPDAMFEFVPPPSSAEIKIIPRKNR
jgi:hypothetical protein